MPLSEQEMDAQLALLVWELEQMYLASPNSLTPRWVHPEMAQQFKIVSYISGKEALFGDKHISLGEKDVFMGVLCEREADRQKVVALRGTESLLEWSEDINTEEKSLGGGLDVEEGFWSLAQTLVCTPASPSFVSRDTLYTGHSLGGALATLLAYKAYATLVTFGSPAVGTAQWEAYAPLCLRPQSRIYINTSDVVPSLPPSPYTQVTRYVKTLTRPEHPLYTVLAPEPPSLIGNHSCLTYAWLIDYNVALPQVKPSLLSRILNWITEAIV